MSERLAGKVALITGAARGVGLATAKLMAKEGAQVIFTDINAEQGQEIANSISSNALFLEHDVTKEADWSSILTHIKSKYGQLNILVNNAAILQLGDIKEETLAGWQKVHRVNSDSVFLGIHYALPLMEESGGGSIVNMSSSSAIFGMPHFAAYGASKAAIRGLSQSVAVYCSQTKNNVRCNTLHPDSIMTPMVMEMSAQAGDRSLAEPERAKAYLCQPEDVANTILFLASDESKHINGAAIALDGGATVTPPYL
ncbi:short-chain dehydrogenase/reductase SDR [Shewanella halifaxensis HAW-EB4]|uniref:Short-chain dehydrogenase/reductase SDR n=1 Tax=Shewanella halifaxensis (strain HAW-EB4) TaxID=458817 RepID=B0TTY5_SHEHH|nr:SDR family oxidoreductase [Shewanella halifaxensis]ABZ76703.1 short-chain dehydrogenase/reductase SDR [Shewanella halifaxensis HAW-EB4]